MALKQINPPFPYWGLFNQGRPVFNGYVYVGTPNLDPIIKANRKAVSLRLQDNSVVEVSQPIRLSPGGQITYQGSPADLMTDGAFAITVLDSKQNPVSYSANELNASEATLIVNAEPRRYGSELVNNVLTLTGITLTAGIEGGTRVIVSAAEQREGFDYTITGANTILFTGNIPLPANTIDVYNATPVTTVVTQASAVSYSPAGTGAVTTNVQARLSKQIFTSDFGTTGLGTADEGSELQAAFDYASSIAVGGERVEVIIPPGLYLHSAMLLPKQNTKIVNNGTVRFTGGSLLGAATTIRAQNNVEITGGVWDSNNQGNDNTIAVTFVNVNLTPAGPASENIWVHDLTVMNAKSGGGTNPNTVGSSGGKGITVQFGAKDVLISDIIVDSCELGVSIEGKEDDSAVTNGIIFNDIIIKEAKYIAMFLGGEFTTPAITEDTCFAIFNNIHLVNCSSGVNDLNGSDIADDFGVISCQSAVGIRATNIQIRNDSGRIEVMRGSHRHCQFDITVDYFNGANIVNTAPYGGALPRLGTSGYDVISVDIKARTADTTGYYLTGNGTQDPNYSDYSFTSVSVTAGAYVAWVGAGTTANLGINCVVKTHDLFTGAIVQSLGALGEVITGSIVGASITADKLAIPDSGIATISGGVITAPGSNFTVAVESGTTDDLDTINGVGTGQIIIISAEDDAGTIVIPDLAAGNLRPSGVVTLNSAQDRVMFIEDSGILYQLSFADNSP